MNPVLAAIIAHQGGWDEVALVAGPIVAIVILLAIAKRRVDAAVPDHSVPPDERPAPPAD